MESLITAAARALQAGDPLGQFGIRDPARVVLRDEIKGLRRELQAAAQSAA